MQLAYYLLIGDKRPDLSCIHSSAAVESRSAAIAAIRDSYVASLTAQLQLMMFQLPIHIRKMPMKKFLEQHCPNTIDNTRSDGTLYFEVVQDPIDSLQTPGELLPFSSTTRASGSQVSTPQAMHHRSEASTIHIISPDD